VRDALGAGSQGVAKAGPNRTVADTLTNPAWRVRTTRVLRTSTMLPTCFGLLLALTIVVGHLWMLGADFSVFVRAAPPFAEPATAPPSLCLLDPEQTYDGQFFYRLALDPRVTRDVGVSLDHPSYRQQRIVYPLLVNVLSLGQESWVPFILVAVNVVGLAVLGYLGARLAIELGGPGWWGAALPFWAGFTFSLAGDLSEIVQACFVVGTLLALQLGRPRLAAVPMALAVLARETAVLLAAALLVSSVVAWAMRRKQSTTAGRQVSPGSCATSHSRAHCGSAGARRRWPLAPRISRHRWLRPWLT
jgi:hypothetical protein